METLERVLQQNKGAAVVVTWKTRTCRHRPSNVIIKEHGDEKKEGKLYLLHYYFTQVPNYNGGVGSTEHVNIPLAAIRLYGMPSTKKMSSHEAKCYGRTLPLHRYFGICNAACRLRWRRSLNANEYRINMAHSDRSNHPSPST